jgi:hypothetical protein
VAERPLRSRLFGNRGSAFEGAPKNIKPICCPQCDERAYVIRHVPDTVKGDGSEVWTFNYVNGHYTVKSGKQ